MDVVNLLLVILCVIKGRVGVLLYMFYGGCRRVSGVLGMVLEPISQPCMTLLGRYPHSRSPWRCIAIDETKLSVKGV
jgi:hypothetical protein